MADSDRALKRIELLKRVRAFHALAGADMESIWVLGATYGATYGLLLSFAAIAVGNAAGATSNSPVVAAFFNLAPYALLGVIGSIIVRRARLQAQTLLG